MTAPSPQRATRIEWTGNIQVHQPFDYSQPLPPMPHYRPREWETQEEAQA